MLVLLDTDHLSILQMRNQPFCDRLEARLSHHPVDQIAVSIVSFHEHVQGWLAWLNRAQADEQIIRGYTQLQSILHDYCRMRLLPFEADAQTIFAALRSQQRRMQTMDLRIAAIALAHNAVLLTRNERDFAKIASLQIEDWTRGE